MPSKATNAAHIAPNACSTTLRVGKRKKNRKPCLYHILNVGIPVRPLIDSFDSNINILARNPGLFEESLLEEPRLKSLKILGQQRQIENWLNISDMFVFVRLRICICSDVCVFFGHSRTVSLDLVQ
jgi:hypothetical protein